MGSRSSAIAVISSHINKHRPMPSTLTSTIRIASKEDVGMDAARGVATFGDSSGHFTKAVDAQNDDTSPVAELFRAVDHVLACLDEVGCITSIGDAHLVEHLTRACRQARGDVGSTHLDAAV